MAAGVIAASFIVAQGCVILALLRFAKSFGAYTESNLKATEMFFAAHQASLLLHEDAVRMLAEAKRSHHTTEKIA